ncbi:TetR/AcrR family transcriptional regulator [Paenibacillus cucumis (ex Kampfer et al. 2016)]|uniref:TetR/AcrR family transcriptional regulator n=1 Tax=Paenibacillus cucumis (ex Kampfer et al. 2016) TaxID=1776858 RepID=A0ABS7KM85_9BACL|nr:TetR/AcrR family transcriptional regulator [Paenibacillus cucumis (ex Kampfer et al. 2016)]MBY0205031.1 TetR/AcrR family transcriptional regulator [Paenibacillus cucumis (ex Kampfer et al. 2016)]
MSEKEISERRNENRNKIIEKLLSYVRKNGFLSLTMDEISKISGVSRATLYKYFSTKDDIIEFLVHAFVQNIEEVIEEEGATRLGIRFQEIFEKSVMLREFLTRIFLQDLEQGYPEQYELLKQTMKRRDEQQLRFYEAGQSQGIFHPVNGKLIALQDEILLYMLDAQFLLENNLTVYQALYDYYQLRKFQLFRTEKLHLVDDQIFLPKLEYMAQKITRNLF